MDMIPSGRSLKLRSSLTTKGFQTTNALWSLPSTWMEWCCDGTNGCQGLILSHPGLVCSKPSSRVLPRHITMILPTSCSTPTVRLHQWLPYRVRTPCQQNCRPCPILSFKLFHLRFDPGLASRGAGPSTFILDTSRGLGHVIGNQTLWPPSQLLFPTTTTLPNTLKPNFSFTQTKHNLSPKNPFQTPHFWRNGSPVWLRPLLSLWWQMDPWSSM